MIRLGRSFLLALIVCAGAPTLSEANQQPKLAAVVAASVDQHIIPSYATLHSDAEKLETDIAAWCGSGGGSGPEREAVDGSFRRAVLSWAAVSYIRFGPARAESRQQHLAFFPDPRGVTARQLGAALSRKDPKLLEAGALQQQSAAIQGLPALELLLTKDGADGTPGIDDYGCRLAMAISANVTRLSRELADAWKGDGWRARMLQPGADNSIYKTHEEAAGELVKAVLTGLQIVRDQGFVAIQEAVKRKRSRIGLAFERSGLARDYLAAIVRSCAALITTLQLSEFVKDDPKFGWMSGWIRNALRSLASDIQEMDMTAEPAPPNRPKGTDRVHRGRFYANGLRQIIGREVAPAAGLTLGFNELDGD